MVTSLYSSFLVWHDFGFVVSSENEQTRGVRTDSFSSTFSRMTTFCSTTTVRDTFLVGNRKTTIFVREIHHDGPGYFLVQ